MGFWSSLLKYGGKAATATGKASVAQSCIRLKH